jgi:hypothetical protein
MKDEVEAKSLAPAVANSVSLEPMHGAVSNADQQPYRLYHFFLHRCVVARSEDEARGVAASEWPTPNGDPFTITLLDRPGHIYVEGAPDRIACAPEVAEYFAALLEDNNLRDPGHEEHFFRELDRFNRAMSDILEAMLQPATFPVVASLELHGAELVGFCLRSAAGDDVNSDTRGYMFLRYPKLRDAIIRFREMWYE